MLVEQKSQLRSCRATLTLANGQSESGIVTVVSTSDGALRQATWESDTRAAQRLTEQQRSAFEAQRVAQIQRAAPPEQNVIFEKDVILYEDSSEFRAFTIKLATLVKMNTYSCDSVSASRPMILSGGYKLVCNKFRYTYSVQDKGGNWVVSVE